LHSADRVTNLLNDPVELGTHLNKLVASMNPAALKLASLLGRTIALAAILVAASSPLRANLTISPTFDSSITSDPNAVAIENSINDAISEYSQRFADPINVAITFQEVSTGLGSNSSSAYNASPYSALVQALNADSKTPNDAVAMASIPGGINSPNPLTSNNPVNGTPSFDIKTANARALGINLFPPGGAPDGIISLNTHLTDVGSPGTAGLFSLRMVVDHEIDEVLGLGSSLPSVPANTIFPEDLFRYHIVANPDNSVSSSRSFTSANTGDVYFSIDGLTKLAQFDNQNDQGDFGDWQSNPLPLDTLPQVQDAFATTGSNPTLGPNELTALDVIGYDLIAVPESGTAIRMAMAVIASASVLSALVARRRTLSA
jgi:hypothetical protein